MSHEQLVHIRVTSNFDNMRRGWEGEVPLTERIEALSMAGYLQILGHVALAVAEPSVPDPVPAPAKPKRLRRQPAATGTEVDDGGSESPA